MPKERPDARCTLYMHNQEAIEKLSANMDNVKVIQIYISKIKEIALLANKKQEDNILLKGNHITRK